MHLCTGFVTSGLELWQGHKCAEDYFRERIWGSLSMTQSFYNNASCWFEHMQLDEKTGMDPEDRAIRLRAAEGLEAVDFFMPGYHVWAKLIESLGDFGYDSNSLVVVLSHSWGDNVFRNFMRWAENEQSGWCEKHLEAYVNIAGPVLGVPKAVTACLSGEMRDTAQLGSLPAIMVERVMPRTTRSRLFRTWGSLIGMLPVGGPNIWGNGTWAPDDTPAMRAANESHGSFISKKEGPYPWSVNWESFKGALTIRNLHDKADLILSKVNLKGRAERKKNYIDHDVETNDIDQAMAILLNVTSKQFQDNVELYGAVHTDELSETGAKQWPEKEFLNPLKDPLPEAPSMRMYCMYGVGSPAERSYHYQHVEDANDLSNEDKTEARRAEGREDMHWKINTEVHDPELGIVGGVRLSDGDGTVPIISTGLMCYKGWRTKRLNPSNIPIVSREYVHQPTSAFKDLRGGPLASAHVEALSNVHLMRDVLKVVAGIGHTLEDDLSSDVPKIAEQIHCFDDDTC
ncbi:TPA: hypothetical protein ACH3X3_008242 [Trebouxia sp. C0006]